MDRNVLTRGIDGVKSYLELQNSGAAPQEIMPLWREINRAIDEGFSTPDFFPEFIESLRRSAELLLEFPKDRTSFNFWKILLGVLENIFHNLYNLDPREEYDDSILLRHLVIAEKLCATRL
jgi:hypothetical protein